MVTNNSPWIHQLDKERKTVPLSQDEKTGIAIIGAGIAGISTAFFLLKHTDKKVILVEGYKLAHGATGHNGGHMVSYFERPFYDIVREFGLEMAVEGQKDVDSAWALSEEMYTEAGLDIPMVRFMSYAGLSTFEQVVGHLENDYLRRSGGLHTYPVEIWEDADFLPKIPDKYHKMFTLATREEIALKLESFDTQYIAVLSSQKGVMNSALFCQEVVQYLQENFPDRFTLYEETPINKVVIHDNSVMLDAGKHTIECDRVVLCTNGFENIDILTPSGLSVNTRFHHSLHGVVGFMSGYLEPYTGIPAAISYYPAVDPGLTDNPGDPYFYVTRRPYEYEKHPPITGKHNLVCVGGPDFALEKRAEYRRDLEFSESAKKQIGDFVRHTYDKSTDLEYIFMWHGVMGYTKNLLRMVGPDPSHSRLLYNLGCNGVGLLPSIFGGNKVARIIAGEKFPPSLFDVPLLLDNQKEHYPARVLS